MGKIPSPTNRNESVNTTEIAVIVSRKLIEDGVIKIQKYVAAIEANTLITIALITLRITSPFVSKMGTLSICGSRAGK
jgi:hypothetical protein